MTKRTDPFDKSYRLRIEACAASIRAEGWIVRRLAPDCWKVSDKRSRDSYRYRPEWKPTRRRHYIFNDAKLLQFAGYEA